MCFSVYAGDVASFVNMGFSQDGTRFSFGQYGFTDDKHQAWAEIFCVDVVKNDFIKEGKFSAGPDSTTFSLEPRAIYASLQNKASFFLLNQKIDSSLAGRPIYILADDSVDQKTLSFRDFETENHYTIEIKTNTEGKGKDVRSAFYLLVSKTDNTGKISQKTVGLPGYKRDGVQDYSIRSIITDNSGKSLVFVIEKKIYAQNGSSIRYMIETLRY